MKVITASNDPNGAALVPKSYLMDLEERVRVLEERVAHAEQARDNAIVQRDAALERCKAKGQRAGAEIGQLKRELMAKHNEVSQLTERLRPPSTPPEAP